VPGLLRLGTSSFTAAGRERSFYPSGLQSRDYLSYYATQFDTLDSTYYGIPPVKTVQNWYAKTPKHFLFALKGHAGSSSPEIHDSERAGAYKAQSLL
jgi:uncharacterized protein YecE (DUF72 family)